MLFIGGPVDGEDLNIPLNEDVWPVPVEEEPLVIHKTCDPVLNIKYVRYTKRHYIFKEQRYAFMVLDGLSEEHVLRSLNKGRWHV